MKESGILRWGDAIDTLQQAAYQGFFGKGKRLYQQGGGTWSLMDSGRIELGMDAPRIINGVLYLVLVDLFGYPQLGGLYEIPLTDAQITGWTLVYADFDPNHDEMSGLPEVNIHASLLNALEPGDENMRPEPLALIWRGTVA